MRKIDYALRYTQKRWQVFPLRVKDKIPAVKWTEMATIDDKMINGWWEHEPNFNIGIACGKRSGIVVLDIDASHGGYESLTELQDKYGKLPDTPVSKTGSGGEHIFFKYPADIEIRNSAGKLGKGLDIRANGGYIVAPPSLHPNGNTYEWVVKPSQVELADMPEWMIELLKEIKPIDVESKIVDGMIPPGQRHEVFLAMAGAMHRKGMSENAIYVALMEENKLRCNPLHDEKDIMNIALSMNNYPVEDAPVVDKPLPKSYDVIELLESEIKQRETDPREVWGIPYAWNYLSLVTGGKQKGELIYGGGEPGVGKSWFFHQDALFTAIGNPAKKIPETPVLLWSGEMRRSQVYKRFFQMLGVSKRAMATGKMIEYDKFTGEQINNWDKFEEAKAIIMNSPIYVADMWLDLKNVKTLIQREIDTHGIQQAVFDYDWLINAPGTGEIEQSQNISRAMKQIAIDFDISIILISSVNKMGMNQTSENVTKANLSGSGKKLHDADVVYILNKFNEKKNNDVTILPKDYWRITTLHVEKAREMDFHLPNGAINYMRETPNPKFREMKSENERPSWL